VKKILFAVMLVAALSLIASAANVKTTATNSKGDASFHGTPGWGNPPASAAKLIFYGGDTNTSDPNEQGFATGDTLLVPDASTYFAVKAPSKVVATGILYNEIATLGTFDPAQGNYDIRTGVTSGSGGKDLAHGSGAQTTSLTGRDPFGFQEYAASVSFTKPLSATSGTTYWVNLDSQCTNSGDGNCEEQFFVDNTTQQTNAINGKLQPNGQIFFNSTYFGFTWTNWCDPSLGQNAQQCAYGSFGIYGQ
jgi:hypothetical protein